MPLILNYKEQDIVTITPESSQSRLTGKMPRHYSPTPSKYWFRRIKKPKASETLIVIVLSCFKQFRVK